MLDCLLYRLGRARAPSFYRVEIAMNLFSEVSVLREWGVQGGKPRMVLNCYGNLREASHAADTYRQMALRRGYARADHVSA
ncbi:WGR domain-containing protein [Sulfitobacter sabulilitoris]|uniref:WGR domain-containing protein n=1 Tax=Sulfitobacter sabulilitoris TaxID=2562655 RepID=A0A5S3PE42_9RHOB|nr:WGR domain-containing protein [Sulfitobacter sabulilitoris]TMM52320.1 WGR domain-containing protein [Sulfitobacter sabulilitoris]